MKPCKKTILIAKDRFECTILLPHIDFYGEQIMHSSCLFSSTQISPQVGKHDNMKGNARRMETTYCLYQNGKRLAIFGHEMAVNQQALSWQT